MRFLMCVVLVLAGMTEARADELQWSDHYANAKQAAADGQKPLLVVLENSADPAGRLDLQSLGSAEKQAELMQHYQLCRMDVATPYGKRVAEAFGVTQYPFTAITDKTARYITYRSSGVPSADHWLATLETRQSGATPVAEQPVMRVEAAKIITGWPTLQPQDESYCPKCVRNQYYR